MNDTPKTHNSDPTDRLRAIAERIASLEEEKEAIADDVKEIFVEAKSAGYDPAALRKAVRYFRLTPDERAKQDEAELVVDTYKVALVPSAGK